MIELQEAVYRYDEHIAVDGVGFQIKKGEKVALLGSNGSGKSTMG